MAFCPRCRGAMGWRDTVCSHCGYDFPPRGTDPLRPVRVILTLFAFAGGALVIGDAYAIAFKPDEYVFVDREGPNAEVWRDMRAYEAGTGKKWIEQPPGTTDLVATYHGIARQRALGFGGPPCCSWSCRWWLCAGCAPRRARGGRRPRRPDRRRPGRSFDVDVPLFVRE
jgi:hypothetical protein